MSDYLLSVIVIDSFSFWSTIKYHVIDANNGEICATGVVKLSIKQSYKTGMSP